MEQFDKMMELVIKPTGDSPVYNCMLALTNGKRNLRYFSATGTFNEGGDPISASCCFRTGSITKPFTAAIVLQLAEDGLFSTEDFYLDIIDEDVKKILTGLHWFAGNNYSGQISVLHLLKHRSGLRDYFADDERFITYVMQNPTQLWNWKSVIQKYFEYGLNKKPTFKPGDGFHYSDTNYLLLAVLIEQVTSKRLHEVFEERIIAPLGLTDTYLEFYQTPKKPAQTVFPYYGNFSLANINTSFDWGGGGLVSTMIDLDIFIRNLIKGRLFKKEETLKIMMHFDIVDTLNSCSKRTIQYGMGLQKKDICGYLFFGHSSTYASMVYYDRVQDLSIILSLNQAAAVHKAEWLMNKIVNTFPH
ncbi:MAG TPA: serine hydrolase domain-containing protein [Chitinophagaceae bacterium]|nr:serine hydrolase domain-containing protein [Chitinophagaceae bacterium]